MMKANKKFTTIISLVIGFVVFIGIALYTNLFSGGELPVQISGALLEAVVTALITYFLLTGQSASEENKERNVKVFEKKSEKFNGFIEELWKVWEDRSVSLEELNDLLKLVSKDIIPYAKPESSRAILAELNRIARLANPDKTDTSDTSTKTIQESVFNIINTLSNEIGLGGKIDGEINKELYALEQSILPHLNRKSNLKTIEELVMQKSHCKLNVMTFDEDGLWWLIDTNKSDVWLYVRCIEGETVWISFWSEFYANRQYQSYRYAQKGKDKDWFKNCEQIDNLLSVIDLRNGNTIPHENLETLADKIAQIQPINATFGVRKRRK